ncbi:MAG: hypothetical protein AAGE76_11395, partial [Pseudomonadota bacterium]
MRALAALFIACLTGPFAAEPRSAIPWLSEVLRTPPAAPGSIVPTASVPPDGPAMPFGVGPITESSLNDPVRDGVGLLAPTETGLPRDLWRGLSALRLRAMINGQPIEGVPGARALYAQMLLAETDPPAGAGPKNGVLLARIDRLMAAGRLAEAEALVDSIGVLDPALFRRAFDIALLTGPVEDRCAQMQAAPPLAPTLPARVFCLARLGDWSAAALTLSLGANVGDVSATEEALLSRFLDPELFEGLPGPDPAPQMTTLDFSLREATALPRPQGPLPLAFEHVDTADGVALRTRLEALERLAREDATPAERLFQAYRSGTPAASGGIWDRMAAAQALDRAFAIADPAPLARAVLAADTLFAQHGLRAALARAYGRQLAALDPTAFDAATSGEIGALLVLAGGRGGGAPPGRPRTPTTPPGGGPPGPPGGGVAAGPAPGAPRVNNRVGGLVVLGPRGPRGAAAPRQHKKR